MHYYFHTHETVEKLVYHLIFKMMLQIVANPNLVSFYFEDHFFT